MRRWAGVLLGGRSGGSVYFRVRVSGIGALMRSKAWRWAGVGSLILSKAARPIVMVARVRVARWSMRPRELRTTCPSALAWAAALASACAERRVGGPGVGVAGGGVVVGGRGGQGLRAGDVGGGG